MTIALTIDALDLPRGLRDIVDLIGIEATLRLVDAWGGVRLYLPLARNLDDSHPLVRQLGREAAARLCEGLGSGDLAVPRALEALRAARDRAIRAEHADGVSARALALRYKLSERRLWEILAAADAPRPSAGTPVGQMTLF